MHRDTERMRVLVTGATGLIGGALALRLARDGVPVRALVRPTADSGALRSAGVELAEGDVLSPASVRDAVRGCTHVVHLAASRAGMGLSAAALHDVNVRGTEHVAAAAVEEGVERLVYGSTLGVHGFIAGGVLDEHSPIRPNTAYRLSKWLAERALDRVHERTGLQVVVARISSGVGPGARAWLPLARGIAEGRLRLLGDGTNAIDLVAVDDLAEGLRLCATAPNAAGRRFVLGSGEPSTVGGFASQIAAALGVPAPQRGPPAAPYRALLHAAALAFRVAGIDSGFAHRREILVADKRASSELARAELGYRPTASVAEAVRAMVERFVLDGRMPPSRAA
jgi:nucleoside-diphosphate-sugar epimerase